MSAQGMSRERQPQERRPNPNDAPLNPFPPAKTSRKPLHPVIDEEQGRKLSDVLFPKKPVPES